MRRALEPAARFVHGPPSRGLFLWADGKPIEERETVKAESIETLGALSNKTTVTGAVVAGSGWLTASSFAAIVGALVAVAQAGFFTPGERE